MRLILALPLAIAFALAACGDSGGDQPKTAQQVASEASSLVKPEPGKYSSTMKIVSFDIPGLPAAQAEQMKQAMSSTGSHTAEYCLTKEEADKGFEEMARKSSDKNCVFDKFDATANTIDARMTCKTPQGGTSTMAMTGAITATSMKMVMDGEQTMPGVPGKGVVKMKMEVTSRRIGDCS